VRVAGVVVLVYVAVAASTLKSASMHDVSVPVLMAGAVSVLFVSVCDAASDTTVSVVFGIVTVTAPLEAGKFTVVMFELAPVAI
jgi:hypothetical protein